METHHVDDPHLLVVERRNLVKLTRGKAEETWRLAQESTPGTQGPHEPSASTQGPGIKQRPGMKHNATTSY